MSFLRRLVAFGLGVATVAAAGAAGAETRLFTVRADQPGITIVAAALDGRSLPVAGQNGEETFFRIDNPAGAVACVNRFRFTTSAGGEVDATADLCARGWDLTVQVAAGNRPASGATVPAADQPIIIAIDDPNVTITEVLLRGEPAEIRARQEPYVEVVLPPRPEGSACSVDLGLVLSDSRRIARLVDVCASDFVVVVPVVGDQPPPPPADDFRPARVTSQPAPSSAAAPPPAAASALPPPAEPGIIDSLQWQFTATASGASLVYGAPASDENAFTAVCTPASSRATITLARTSGDLVPGGRVNVRFAAGALSKDYAAAGAAAGADGLSHPVLQIATSDPLWPALIRERVLTIAIGQEAPYGLSLSGSAAMAKRFLAACNPAPAVPTPPVLLPPGSTVPVAPPMAGPGGSVSYRCDDGSGLAVAFSADTAVVSEYGAPPVVLFQAPSQGGARYVAGLSELVGAGEQIFWTRQGGFTRACVPE